MSFVFLQGHVSLKRTYTYECTHTCKDTPTIGQRTRVCKYVVHNCNQNIMFWCLFAFVGRRETARYIMRLQYKSHNITRSYVATEALINQACACTVGKCHYQIQRAANSALDRLNLPWNSADVAENHNCLSFRALTTNATSPSPNI